MSLTPLLPVQVTRILADVVAGLVTTQLNEPFPNALMGTEAANCCQVVPPLRLNSTRNVAPLSKPNPEVLHEMVREDPIGHVTKVFGAVTLTDPSSFLIVPVAWLRMSVALPGLLKFTTNVSS